MMNLVVAIIKPFKLSDVHDALHALGIPGLTVYEAKGHGRQKGHAEIYQAVEYVAHFIPKIRIEVVVPEEITHSAVHAIMSAARTGQGGDGKIYVHPLNQFLKIRTGETDKDAL